jgi:hypothetical protein
VCTDDTRHILHLNNQSGVNYYNIPINQSDLVVQGKTRFTRSLGELSNIKSGLEFGHSNFSSNSATDTSLQKENFVAAFTESDMYLTKNIVLRLGVRAENSTLVNKSNAAPRISMAYKFRDESQFSLAYGIFYQSPDISYIKQGLHNYEEATHYVVNFQKMSDNRTFRMETFYKKYNKLTLIDPNNQSLSTNGNGYAQGAELFWRDKKSFNNIDYWISYSFLDTKRKYIYYPMNIVPDFASKHTFSMVYKQFVPQISSNLGLTYTAASGHTYTNPNDTKPLNSYTPPYNNLSFTASYIHNVKGTWIVVVASVSNILGFDNILSYKYSANGSYRIPIKESDKRFYFIGVFLSIGRDNSNDVF